MPVRVVARMIARQEAVEQVKSMLTSLIEPTRKEKGCIAYQLLQNTEDPTDFTFVEEWDSQGELQIHLKSEHLTAVVQKLPAVLSADPDIRTYTVVE